MTNQKSQAQFQNHIKPQVIVRRITHSIMHKKGPICQPELMYGI